jgi:hypothetical protein
MFHVKNSPMVLGWITLFHVEHPWSKRLEKALKKEKYVPFSSGYLLGKGILFGRK